ncbi:hypothetical protein A0H81_14407 [Grifola frondosa]|uniref:Uncharacterized protein n=1 Tax=Grifola frondosa TaxID=5627 RepID=A0A1C7LLI6_GRIFR|nr:hypothetical protein A0H81_14407 [Grifola frondosa]
MEGWGNLPVANDCPEGAYEWISWGGDRISWSYRVNSARWVQNLQVPPSTLVSSLQYPDFIDVIQYVMIVLSVKLIEDCWHVSRRICTFTRVPGPSFPQKHLHNK